MKNKIVFKKKFALNLHKQYVKVETELHELKYFFWECTLRCNINCLHCGSDCHKESSIKDMPINDFLKVTEQIAKVQNPNKTMIVLTGGEPLMRKVVIF
jgi:MoaA/NifB/PqqE/SkfB family radical SAM enzyme